MRYIVRLGAVWLGIVGALLLIVGLVSFWLGSSPEDDNFAWEADLMRFIGLFGLVVRHLTWPQRSGSGGGGPGDGGSAPGSEGSDSLWPLSLP
jgi:hypothetical protein